MGKFIDRLKRSRTGTPEPPFVSEIVRPAENPDGKIRVAWCVSGRAAVVPIETDWAIDVYETDLDPNLDNNTSKMRAMERLSFLKRQREISEEFEYDMCVHLAVDESVELVIPETISPDTVYVFGNTDRHELGLTFVSDTTTFDKACAMYKYRSIFTHEAKLFAFELKKTTVTKNGVRDVRAVFWFIVKLFRLRVVNCG